MSERRRALLSVWDKTGLLGFARGLDELGFELVASGGTARALRDEGLEVVEVSDVTRSPEILGGRVKTLHPGVHGGILARRTPGHLAELARHGIRPVDLVVCNLYPFERAAARRDLGEAEVIEEIDIGGVTLLRAAAKNFESVVVVCDPWEYDAVLSGLAAGTLDLDRRRALALAAFRHTAAYDAAIASWMTQTVEGAPLLPAALNLTAERDLVLRYGENPHQQAALYRWRGHAPAYECLQGKELSYNNLIDLEAAWAMPNDHLGPCVAIVKHTNPCGLAVGDTPVEAFAKALESDPVSAFGSIIAVNRPVDEALVEAIGKLFVEVLVAPAYTPGALDLLSRRKKQCRVMQAAGPPGSGLVLRSVAGGLLVQTPDHIVEAPAWRVVTQRQPTETEREELAFAWRVVKHVKSNGIVFTRGGATVGVGAGQMNRVESVRLAARQAGERARGAVVGSDAFFPFADGLEAAAEAGVTAVIQPGGSMRDDEVIAAADRLGLAMVFTGERHFRH